MQSLGMKAEAQLFFQSHQSSSPSRSDIALYVFFSIFAVLFIIGVIVEYTALFGQPDYNGMKEDDDSRRDKELIKSKDRLGLFFLSFSPSRNLRKMFYAPQRKDDYLTVFNGIRVISMYYVILGHTPSAIGMVPNLNLSGMKTIPQTWWSIYFAIGFYSVDVFFFISSFLAKYLMISKFQGKRIFNIGMVYLHRLIRLVPSLLLFMGLFIAILPLTGSGDLWSAFLDQYFVDP